MTERPILFSAPMVRAILDGRKTQTRRIIKPQPPAGVAFALGGGAVFMDWVLGGSAAAAMNPQPQCPYGKVGDRLWVRETFSVCEMDDGRKCAYRATGDKIGCLKWKPSIFMPRAASRITLEITGVRVERLQDISEHDAEDEGAGDWADYMAIAGKAPLAPNGCADKYNNYRQAFRGLWKSINGPESWAANPWVWVIEFKRVQS